MSEKLTFKKKQMTDEEVEELFLKKINGGRIFGLPQKERKRKVKFDLEFIEDDENEIKKSEKDDKIKEEDELQDFGTNQDTAEGKEGGEI